MEGLEDIVLERMRRKQQEKETAKMQSGGGLGRDIGQFLIGGAGGFADALAGTTGTATRALGTYNREDTARLKALEGDEGIGDLITLWKIQEAANLARERDAASIAADSAKEQARDSRLEKTLSEQGDRLDKTLTSQELRAQQALAAAREKDLRQEEEKRKAPKEGEKTLDREFAKEYSEWSSTGKPDFDKNVAQLGRAVTILQSKKDATLGATGKWTALIPDKLRSGEDLAIQQDVEQAAVASLRAALGAQFTEKEGERIMKQSFDPILSEEENIRKILATIEKLTKIAQAKDKKASFFRENRTLQGMDMESSGKIKVTNGQETLEIDASDLVDAQNDGFRVVQ